MYSVQIDEKQQVNLISITVELLVNRKNITNNEDLERKAHDEDVSTCVFSFEDDDKIT